MNALLASYTCTPSSPDLVSQHERRVGTKLVAPNLVESLGEHSVAEFERIVRHGVRLDGSGVVLIMPSEMYANLSDASLGAIIAYLQSLQSSPSALPDTRFGPLARIMLTIYKQETGSPLAADLMEEVAPGRYAHFTDAEISALHGFLKSRMAGR